MMDEEKLKPEEEEPKAPEDEQKPAEETTPTEEPVSIEEPTPAEEPKPVIEPKPVAEPKPMPTVGKPKTAGIAIAGFICGLLGLIFLWVPFVGFVLPVLGIILGAVGRARVNSSRGQLTGSGFATAGLICGVVALGLVIILMIAGVGFMMSMF